jgi:hypothetical protein
LSSVPFDILGFKKDLVQSAPSEVTWRILEQVPNVVLMGAWVLGGFYFLYRRRQEVKAAEAHQADKGGHGDAK